MPKILAQNPQNKANLYEVVYQDCEQNLQNLTSVTYFLSLSWLAQILQNCQDFFLDRAENCTNPAFCRIWCR